MSDSKIEGMSQTSEGGNSPKSPEKPEISEKVAALVYLRSLIRAASAAEQAAGGSRIAEYDQKVNGLNEEINKAAA